METHIFEGQGRHEFGYDWDHINMGDTILGIEEIIPANLRQGHRLGSPEGPLFKFKITVETEPL